MRSNILNKVLQRGRKGNPLSRIDALEQKNNAQFLRNPSADRLTDITQDLGTILSGSFIAPAQEATSAEPTDTGFTGAAMGGDGWTFGSTVYHFVAVAAGVLQAGFNSLGKLIAGAGAVTLDVNGIDILRGSGTSNSITWVDGSGNTKGYINTDDGGTGDNTVAIISADSTIIDNEVVLTAYGGGTTQENSTYRITGGDAATVNRAHGEIKLGAASVIKYYPDEVTINEDSNDINFRVETNGNAFTLMIDGGLDAVGLGGAAESGYILKATGKVKTTGDIDATAGINVGSATGAGTGDVKGSGELIMSGTGASSVGGDFTVANGITLTNGTIRSYGGSNIADDNAVSFTPTRSFGVLFFGTNDNTVFGQIWYNTATPQTVALSVGSNTNVTTGVLAGTTGTDTKFTISAHTDGKIYLENRRGANRLPNVLLI